MAERSKTLRSGGGGGGGGRGGSEQPHPYLQALRDSKSRRNLQVNYAMNSVAALSRRRFSSSSSAAASAARRRTSSAFSLDDGSAAANGDAEEGGRPSSPSPSPGERKQVAFSAFPNRGGGELGRDDEADESGHDHGVFFGTGHNGMDQSGHRRVGFAAAPGSTAMVAWRELVVESLNADGNLDYDDGDDSDGDDSEVEAHAHRLPLYCRPLQRQRWLDSDHPLPHINWGDLFFDLFYVAAAYNLGALLISSMTPDLWGRGVLYFVGIFGSLFNVWESKLVYEARYSVVDYFHRTLEVVRVFFLSFSILHIKPIELMSDPRSMESFSFCLGLLLECCVRIFLKAELIKVGRGDREAICNHSKKKLMTSYVPLALFYLAAVIVSGIGYFRQEDPNGGAGYGGDKYGDDGGYHHDKEYDSGGDGHGNEDDGHHRLLAGLAVAPASLRSELGNFAAYFTVGDVPITLCAVSYLLNTIFGAVRKTVWLRSAGDFRRQNVPSNIDFCIHRYGEFTMLMLGEAVLSLLIVETTENGDYYFVALFGVLTVVALQALHFESEPSHADHHALWRSIQAGMWYSVFLQLLCMGLVAFGVSYKVMLKILHKEAEKAAAGYGDAGGGYGGGGDDYGGDGEYGGGGGYGSDGDGHRRWLIDNPFVVGSSDGPLGFGHRSLAGSSPAVTERAAAALFCGSLTVALFSLEMLTSTHRGMRENFARLWRDGKSGEGEAAAVLRLEILALNLFKVGLGLFLATLSQWLNDPVWIALAGFFVVAFLAVTRVVGWNVFHAKKKKKKKKTTSKSGAENSAEGKPEAAPPPMKEVVESGSAEESSGETPMGNDDDSSRRSSDEFVENGRNSR